MNAQISAANQYFITSTATLAGTLMVSVASGFTPPLGNTFTIINNQGSDPVQGTFAGLPEGAIIETPSEAFQISYHGGDGNDVTVTKVALDFGDAPDSYHTLLASNGARHVATGPILGSSRDTEADGQPSPNADADPDEDGVTFSTLYYRQTSATAT